MRCCAGLEEERGIGLIGGTSQKFNLKIEFKTELRFFCSKSGLPELEQFEIKYWEEGFEV
jgi:hypothetical protein